MVIIYNGMLLFLKVMVLGCLLSVVCVVFLVVSEGNYFFVILEVCVVYIIVGECVV